MRSTSRLLTACLMLSIGCNSGGGGTVNVGDSGTPGTDIAANGDRPATGDGGAACAATTCGACTPMGSCGWCRRTNRCMQGTGTGSSDMSCSGTDWNYLPSQCPDYDGGPPADVPPVMCNTSTTCGTCAPRGGCGWCATTNSCLPGNSMGSTNGMCTGMAWQYLPSQCPGFDGGAASCRGIPRDCMLTIAGGVRTCTAGQMVTIGCNAGCSPALGSCTGDAVMQICPGTSTTTACSGMAVIASNDDAPTSAMCNGGDGGSSLCPVTTFMCPSNGMYTVWVGSYDPTEMATCTPAVR